MRSSFPVVLLLAAACGPPASRGSAPEDVRLEVEPGTAAAGDSVTLVLTNGSSAAVGYNLCTSALERRTDDGWEAVPSDRICTMELRTLPAGGEARYSLAVEPGLTAGDYRYRTDVERLDTGARESIASGAFRIEP